MNENLSKEEKILIGDDEILYKDLAYFFIRNSKKLVTILSIGLSISLIFTLRLKNVWQGEFQIVLEDEETPQRSLSQIRNSRANLLLDENINSSLNTQVEILKSASVLMPIYNASILRKQNHPNDNNEISFNSWKRNLNIKLKKGTSVLDIKYKNTNKGAILPILLDISKAYQKYSTDNLNKDLAKGIDYLNNQIKIYRKKSNISYENSQKFALENDLQVITANPNLLRTSTNFNNPIIGLSSQDQRISAAKQKRLLYEIAAYFEDENTDNEKLLSLAKNYELVGINTLSELSEVQSEINSSKAFFTDNYSQTKKLIRQKEAILENIKNSSLKIILARIDVADAIIESSKRPEGVYIKSNRLNNEYVRDNFTLSELEAQLRLLSLEKAKEPEPYKLITNPTLLDRKIAPVRSRILIIISFFLTSITILYIRFEEKVKDFIYSSKEIESSIPYNLLEKIPSNYPENWDKYLITISSLYFKKKNKIEMFKLGGIDDKLLDLLLSKLKNINPDIEIKLLNNISEANNKNNLLLLVQSGKIKREEVANFKRIFKYGEFNIMGWIFFEEIISFKKNQIEN